MSTFEIPLGDGEWFAVADEADRERLGAYSWRATGSGYARALIGGRPIMMHRFLMEPPAGMFVDHIDGDGWNNRRSNLRVCTPAQNRANARAPRLGGGSWPVGVAAIPGRRFEARIAAGGKLRVLGRFRDIEEAARAYDAAARETYGDFARLNCPGPQERGHGLDWAAIKAAQTPEARP